MPASESTETNECRNSRGVHLCWVDARDRWGRASKITADVGGVHRRPDHRGKHQAAILPIVGNQMVSSLLSALFA
jgi:hypothetical protein